VWVHEVNRQSIEAMRVQFACSRLRPKYRNARYGVRNAGKSKSMQVLGCFASHVTELLVDCHVDCALTSESSHHDWKQASRINSEPAVLDQHGYGGKHPRLPTATKLCCTSVA